MNPSGRAARVPGKSAGRRFWCVRTWFGVCMLCHNDPAVRCLIYSSIYGYSSTSTGLSLRTTIRPYEFTIAASTVPRARSRMPLRCAYHDV